MPNGLADERRSSATWSRRLLWATKLLVTAVLCGVIVTYVDWGLFWETLRNSRLWVIGLVLLMRLGGLTISAFKWQQLLVIHGVWYRVASLVRWYFVATFLNHFLPTSIGGDAYRIYKTLGKGRRRSRAVSAVLVERATGLAALVLLGYGAAIATYAGSSDPLAGTVAAIISVALIAGVAFLWLIFRFRLVHKLAEKRLLAKPLNALLVLGDDFRRAPRRSAAVAGISFAFHINKICVVWLLLYALGTTANILELAVAVVTVDVVGLLPISFGGLGVVEGSFIYVMGHFGVAHESGLAAMLLMRALLIPFSLLGAYFYFVGERSGQETESGVREPQPSRLAKDSVK